MIRLRPTHPHGRDRPALPSLRPHSGPGNRTKSVSQGHKATSLQGLSFQHGKSTPHVLPRGLSRRSLPLLRPLMSLRLISSLAQCSTARLSRARQTSSQGWLSGSTSARGASLTVARPLRIHTGFPIYFLPVPRASPERPRLSRGARSPAAMLRREQFLFLFLSLPGRTRL